MHGGLLDGRIIEQITDKLSDFILIIGILLVELEAEFLNGEVGLSFPLHNLNIDSDPIEYRRPQLVFLPFNPQKTSASLKQQRWAYRSQSSLCCSLIAILFTLLNQKTESLEVRYKSNKIIS